MDMALKRIPSFILSGVQIPNDKTTTYLFLECLLHPEDIGCRSSDEARVSLECLLHPTKLGCKKSDKTIVSYACLLNPTSLECTQSKNTVEIKKGNDRTSRIPAKCRRFPFLAECSNE